MISGVSGHDEGFLARSTGDRALPGVILPSPGVVESFGVVPELTQDAGGQRFSKTRLAEVNVSCRVPPKMFGYHHLQLGDLFVQRGEHADLADDDRRVGALSLDGLPQ